MRESVSSAKISRLAAAVAGLWLLCAGPAWAGGGMDAAALQDMLCKFVSDLGILTCPRYPTYLNIPTGAAISPATPIVVELAAWENYNPDTIRILDSDCVQEGPGAGGPYCPQLAVNAINTPVKSPREDDEDAESWRKDTEHEKSPAALSHLNPLAFVGATSTTPFTVTQKLDPNATSYVYAVVEGDNGQSDTLDLFFRTGSSKKHTRGPVATISFPLAVLANGASTENSVVATLQINATCNGAAECLSAKVSADFSGTGTKKTYSLADLGLNLAYFSSPSPTYLLQIPLLVNHQTDPFFFLLPPHHASLPQCPNGINQISGYCNVFSQTNPPNGFAPKFLANTVIGMAPSAAPQCPGPQPGTQCPTQSNPAIAPIPPTFGFCATFSNDLAAAFFLAIGPDGTTYISSLVAPSPIMPPAQYPACPS
jgi:hypothetical protein